MKTHEQNETLTDDQKSAIAQVRKAHFATVIASVVPASQEDAFALMNLEQAAMWANKGISRGIVRHD